MLLSCSKTQRNVATLSRHGRVCCRSSCRDDVLSLACHSSFAATRWREGNNVPLEDEGVSERDLSFALVCLRCCKKRLIAQLGSAPAPLFGFGWIWLHAMHAMVGKHLRVECVCKLDGGRRKAKVGRTGIELARDRDVSVGELDGRPAGPGVRPVRVPPGRVSWRARRGRLRAVAEAPLLLPEDQTCRRIRGGHDRHFGTGYQRAASIAAATTLVVGGGSSVRAARLAAMFPCSQPNARCFRQRLRWARKARCLPQPSRAEPEGRCLSRPPRCSASRRH